MHFYVEKSLFHVEKKFTHFHARKSAYMLENLPLVHGSKSLVFAPMELDHGISTDVLIPSIELMVFCHYGFGLWY